MGGQRHAPAALYPRERAPVPILQESGWAPGPVWTSAENPPLPLGFDPWTVRPVENRYTDWASSRRLNPRNDCGHHHRHNRNVSRYNEYALGWTIHCSIPSRFQKVSLLQNVQTGSAAHPGTFSKGTNSSSSS